MQCIQLSHSRSSCRPLHVVLLAPCSSFTHLPAPYQLVQLWIITYPCILQPTFSTSSSPFPKPDTWGRYFLPQTLPSTIFHPMFLTSSTAVTNSMLQVFLLIEFFSWGKKNRALTRETCILFVQGASLIDVQRGFPYTLLL